MGNEVTVGVLQAILRLKDELTPALQGMGSKIGEVGNTLNDLGSRALKVFTAQQFQQVFGEIGQGMAEMIEKGSRIKDMSDRMGITAEAVQKLAFAAKQGGAPMEVVAGAIRTMSGLITDGKLPKALADAAGGLDNLRKMTPDQAFLALAGAVERIPEPMRQIDAAGDAFGKRFGQSLLPAIKDGFVQIANTAPRMKNDTVAALDAIGDKLQKLQDSLNATRSNSLSPLMKLFLDLPESVQTTLTLIGGMVPSLEKIGIAILAVGGPKAALLLLKETAVAVGGWFSTTFLGFFAGIATFFTTTLPAAFGAVIAFLGPQGLIAVAVIALGVIWYAWGEDIKKVHIDLFNTIKTWMFDKLNALMPTLKPGLEIISTWFHDTKDKSVAYAQQLYEGVKAWLVDKFQAIIDGVKAKFNAVIDAARHMYQAVVGGSIVPDMVNGIKGQFDLLDSVMVQPAKLASAAVEQVFTALANKVKSLVNDMLSHIGLGMSQVSSGLGSLGGGGSGGGGGVGFGGSFMSGLGGGLADLAVGLIGKGISALTNKLRGGEEGILVNPARDAFFQQFQTQFGGDQQGALATALANAGIAGDVADRLIQQVYKSDTMKEFEAATKAVNEALAKGTQTATIDSANLATTSAQSSQAVNSLNAAIAALAGTAQTAATTIGASPLIQGLGSTKEPGGVTGRIYDNFADNIPQLAGGTGGRYPDWGRGSLVMLHGREAVTPEGQGAGLSLSITMGDIHVASGNTDEVRRSVAAAVLDALEHGGPSWNKFRILANQAVA